MIRLVILTALSLTVLAQQSPYAGAGGFELPLFIQQAEPRTAFPAPLTGVIRSEPVENGIRVHRFVQDNSRKIYWAYDAVIEPDLQADGYRITFEPPTMSLQEVAPRGRQAPAEARLEAVFHSAASLPPAQLLRLGGTVVVELEVDTANMRKASDYVTVTHGPQEGQWFARTLAAPTLRGRIAMLQSLLDRLSGTPQPPPGLQQYIPPPTPTAEGQPRPFTVHDAEMRIAQPRVRLNDSPVEVSGPAPSVTGRLPWVYIPGYGRFVLSLAEIPGLGFKRAGEVRGGMASFQAANASVVIECPLRIASGQGVYDLYVLHDEGWLPVPLERQDQARFGTVDPRELERTLRN